MEIVVLQDLDVLQPAFDHRIGAGLAVFFKQMAFQRSAIHADSDRATMILGGFDHLADAFFRPDVAWVDP